MIKMPRGILPNTPPAEAIGVCDLNGIRMVMIFFEHGGEIGQYSEAGLLVKHSVIPRGTLLLQAPLEVVQKMLEQKGALPNPDTGVPS